MRSLLVLLSLLAVLPLSPAAADPSLLRDLYPGTESFQVAAGIWASAKQDGVTYFPASDPAHGSELWRSDGTPAGTYRVTDICAGPCNGAPEQLTSFRGEIYFVAADGISGRELWASDGTRGNARRVRDICPGPCNGNPAGFEELGGRLLFEASVGTARGLWSTNGSRRGTALVRHLCEAADNPYTQCSYGGIYRVGNLVLFSMNDSRLGLWRSDGTRAGTGPFADIVPDAESAGFMALVPVGGNATFMWSEDGLWWTDGTAQGTRHVRTAAELGVERSVYLPFSVRNTIWQGTLVAILPGQTLLRSDGTPAGTVVLGQLPSTSNLIGFAALPDSLLIALQSPDVLWRTEGTPETTRQVMEIPGYLYDISPVGDRAVLCVQEPGVTPDRNILWVTDGTEGGTRPLAGAPPAFGCGVSSNLPAAGRLLFLAQDWSLWGTDGTAAGTSEIHAFGEVPASGGPLSQIALGGQLLFAARTSEDDAPLFLSDGTASGTRQISRQAGWAHGLARVGGRVFFEASERAAPGHYPTLQSRGLWSSDGTAAGTRAVAPDISSYGSPMPVGNALFFSAAHEYSYYGDPDLELFRSDGTRQHTGLVKNVNDFGASTGHHHICYNAPSNPGPGIDLGGRLLFVADDGLKGRELWASDGTAGGTRLVRDVDPRRLPEQPAWDCDERQDTGVGSDPAWLVRFGDAVLFAATDGAGGRELWRSDGTTAGTRRVKDLRPGAVGSNPHDLVVFHGKVWFTASTEGTGEALWRTDGTAAGTQRVHPLTVNALPSWASELTVAGGRLYFRVYNEATGAELWATRGDAASTAMVADLRPGPASSAPQSLTAAGNAVVFAADDGIHGLEPWQSDGTAAGTLPLGDINPGLDASGAGPFTPVSGNRVLAGADDGAHGREPWAIPVGASPP